MADEPTLTDLASDLAGAADVKDEPVEQETTPAESSPEETKSPEVAEPVPDGEPDAEAESEEDPAEEPEAPEEPDKPTPVADKRREGLSTEIRDLVQQRNAIKQEVERLNAQVYAPQSVEQLMQEQGLNATDARLAAMEQRVELSDYNNRIAESQLTLSSESERVLSDFPIFNPNSPDYIQEVASQAAEILRSNLLTDPNTGKVIGSNISPYQLYKTIADANRASAVQHQIQGQKDTEQMLAAADPASSAPPAQKKEDPFLSGLLGT